MKDRRNNKTRPKIKGFARRIPTLKILGAKDLKRRLISDFQNGWKKLKDRVWVSVSEENQKRETVDDVMKW